MPRTSPPSAAFAAYRPESREPTSDRELLNFKNGRMHHVRSIHGASMARRPTPYSRSETQELLARSEGERRERMLSDDMICLSDAARLAGVASPLLRKWVNEGRVIGLEWRPRDWRLPAWQFKEPFWELLGTLASALGTAQGWALLTFLETPHPALQGATPKEALLRGVGAARIREIAEAAE